MTMCLTLYIHTAVLTYIKGQYSDESRAASVFMYTFVFEYLRKRASPCSVCSHFDYICTSKLY